MNLTVVRGCAAVIWTVSLVALGGCSSGSSPSANPVSASSASPSGAATVRPSSTPGTLSGLLLPASDLPGGLTLAPNQEDNLGPLPDLRCNQATETYASSPNSTAQQDGIVIQVSDCPQAEPRMPVTWLTEAGMYGQPDFTDITSPAISPGWTAVAEVATPAWFSPPTASATAVVVTWANENIVATILVVAHTPFPPYASESGAEALARLQAGRITSSGLS